MKQHDLFGGEFSQKEESQYTSKISTPNYEPKNKKPHVLELFDDSKTKRLINEINSSNLDQSEKNFLIEAARRHTIFNYSKIADYYAHSSQEVQHLMEKSALVIIDFEKAFELGFVKLALDTANNYFDNYED